MALNAGVRLGPYEILAPLGAGGMGEVYRARDTRLGREVAIKVLAQHLSANAEVRTRFGREAKTVSSLNHPNICTLFDVGRAAAATEPHWVSGAREILCIGNDWRSLYSIPMTPGQDHAPVAALLLFRTAYDVDYPNWDVASDGTRFLILTPNSAPHAVSTTIVVNWTALLERR